MTAVGVSEHHYLHRDEDVSSVAGGVGASDDSRTCFFCSLLRAEMM